MAELKGIQWSAPVLIGKQGKALAVALPDRVVRALALEAGDVLNFTQLPDGAVEVWKVNKSTYASLDDMAPGGASKPKTRAPSKGGGRR